MVAPNKMEISQGVEITLSIHLPESDSTQHVANAQMSLIDDSDLPRLRFFLYRVLVSLNMNKNQ